MNKMVNGALAGLVLAGAVVPVQQVEAAQANHTLDHVDIRIHNANFTLNSITYNPDGSIANQESETKQADVTKAHAVIINYTSGGSVQLDNFSFTNEDGGEIRAMFHDNGLGKLKFGDIASVTFVVDLKAKDGSVYNNVNVTLSGQYMHDAYDRCPGWDYTNKGLDFLIPASDNVSVTLEAYNVTVNYIDEATGQQIAQSYIDNVVEGHSYDVSNKDDEVVIDGYEYVRTEGNVTGSNMSGNQVVNVYYRQLENYSVTINYLDAETEETIAESYLSELIREGGSYDVSHLDDEKVIEGFTFSHVEGDEPSGVMDENKVINVFYNRIPEEYTLTINYLDKETGEPLGDPHSQVIIEDEEYNVSHLDDEIEFDKYDYVETRGELEGIASGDVVIDVFYERKSVPIPYDITVKYVDEEGNEIHDPFIQEDVNAGTEWDVSDKDDEVEIDGYEYIETQGETSGERLNGDKEIIVVYRELEEFDVTVRYEDEEGKELQDPFVKEDVREGEEFDVTGETEVEIPGYVREEVKGEPSGVVDEDEVIVVIYRPLEEFSVTINYLDEKGNVLHEQHSQVVVEGEGYDVSHLDDEIEIDGFNYKATEGDELVDDAIDSDRVINVIYSPIPTHDITVRYEDEEGKEIHDPFIQEDVREGEEFNVSDKDDEVEIPGYVYVETQGETEGVVDEDEEIVVVYRPLDKFNLIINYLDVMTGKPIGEAHMEGILEGQSYDVSHLDDEVEFEGYEYVRTQGELVGEDVQGNVVINVYYIQEQPELPDEKDVYHDVIIRWVDMQGTDLMSPLKLTYPEGDEYDVSDLDDEFEFYGYQYLETQGITSGIVDGDKEIIVVYRPDFEFKLEINYLDIDTGEVISEQYREKIYEGESYNVRYLDDIYIEGYEYVKTEGDLVGHNVQEDIVINVYFTKEKVQLPDVEPEPQEPEVKPAPKPQEPAEPQKPEQPAQPKPEAPKGEVEFDVPQTGIDAMLYSAIATGLAGAGFAVRRKRK